MTQQESLTKVLLDNIKSQQKQDQLKLQMQVQNTVLLILLQGAFKPKDA